MNLQDKPAAWTSDGLLLTTDSLTAQLELGADNPWLTLGIMNAIEGEPLLSQWERVLNLQTDLFGDEELAWLRREGFGAGARGILEVGSANGNYGKFLARSLREVRVMGVEANPHFIERFQRGAGRASPPSSYGITPCKVGEDPLPEGVQGQFDQCILRFVLQHVSDPGRVLRALHDALPAGGRLYLIEEDDHFFTQQPAWAPFEATADTWRRVCAAGGSDSKIGRKLPRLVTAAGFTIDRYDIVLRNNVELGNPFLDFCVEIMRMFHLTNPDLVPGELVRAVEAQFQETQAGHAERYVATYPQFLLSASR